MRQQAPFFEMTPAQREAAEGNFLQDDLRGRLA